MRANSGEPLANLRGVTGPSLRHLTAADAQLLRIATLGFAAEQNGRAIGAGWAIFLPAEDAGYGFVDIRTPELSLWVHREERGHGLGRHLLRLLKSEARRRGVPGLSLSVESGNFATQLYEVRVSGKFEGTKARA